MKEYKILLKNLKWAASSKHHSSTYQSVFLTFELTPLAAECHEAGRAQGKGKEHPS